MYLDHFAQTLLALLIQFGTHAGNSAYSLEPVPACGLDPAKASCDVQPVCATLDSWKCAAPRWSASRNAWVVAETQTAAYRRYQGIAASIARVSFLHARCKDARGVVHEDCQPSGWPEGPESLALAIATTAVNESALREDIQFGYPPMGRGPDHEACLMQAMPAQISQFASWIPKAEKDAYARMNNVQKHEQEEAWVAQMLGDTPDALDKCLDVGARMLARARGACRGGLYGMWSMYGTGNTCHLPEGTIAEPSFARKRVVMYDKMRAVKKPTLPESVKTALGDRNRARRDGVGCALTLAVRLRT